jgi:hypothetical protein
MTTATPNQPPVAPGEASVLQPLKTVSQAQYTPVAAGTVASLRQTIGKGKGNRATTPAISASTSEATGLEMIRFSVRVAHARYLPRTTPEAPPAVAWSVYNDSWNVAITASKSVTFDDLKDLLRQRGQVQYIEYLLCLTRPDGWGHWTLAQNHLASNNPIPQIWCYWEGHYRLQEAMELQDHYVRLNNANATGKGKPGIITYPVTLLWYPVVNSFDSRPPSPSFAIGDDSLLPGADREATTASNRNDDDLESLQSFYPSRNRAGSNTATAMTAPVPSTTHKRQISQAIPSNERPNAPEEKQEDPKASKDPQAGTEGLRKSTRARKPQRN